MMHHLPSCTRGPTSPPKALTVKPNVSKRSGEQSNRQNKPILKLLPAIIHHLSEQLYFPPFRNWLRRFPFSCCNEFSSSSSVICCVEPATRVRSSSSLTSASCLFSDLMIFSSSFSLAVSAASASDLALSVSFVSFRCLHASACSAACVSSLRFCSSARSSATCRSSISSSLKAREKTVRIRAQIDLCSQTHNDVCLAVNV